MTETKCPVCGKAYDHTIESPRTDQPTFRDDVAVCTQPRGENQVAFVHYERVPIVSRVREKDRSAPTPTPTPLRKLLGFDDNGGEKA